MQHLLGWNLVLSLPAILLVAWLAGFGPLLGLGRPQDQDEIEPGSPTARRLRLAL
jgi:hypothetical protein